MNDLENVKQQKWFYTFSLPDGSKTESYLSEGTRGIHVTREKALRHYLGQLDKGCSSAMDIACHEGFFSLILAEYFETTMGIDKNRDSLEKAIQISRLLGAKKVKFENVSVENWGNDGADFVLCFGLLYHTENPIQILRKIASLAKKAICIETQVLPFQISGRIEDGSYLGQRDLTGLFGLCMDYSHRKEGGLTDLALIPSRDGLLFLLQQFGFNKIELYQPSMDDYEQFVRGSRIIVYAEK